MKQIKSNIIKSKNSKRKGSAIFETCVGISLLLPVFFLLVDIIAMVLSQSINDDLAKQAAYYEGSQTANDAASSPNAADTYINGTPYANTTNGWIRNAQVIKVNWAADNSNVQVITQVTCYLPIAMPPFVPATFNFQSQFTAPISAIPLPAN